MCKVRAMNNLSLQYVNDGLKWSCTILKQGRVYKWHESIWGNLPKYWILALVDKGDTRMR